MSHTVTPYSSKAKDGQFKIVFYILMGMGVLIYWVYMTLLEQPSLGFEEVLLFIPRMFQLTVLRHLIPLVIGWWLARIAALTLVELLYDLPNRHTARVYLSNRHTPYNKGKPIQVTRATLKELRSTYTTIGVGGPGLIQISNGEVAITERDGHVFNIHKAGVHYLKMLERIHSILDLRPQTRVLPPVTAYTREYMPMTANITLRFRIDTGEVNTNNGNPYPINKEAVRKIVYGRNVKEDGELSDWDAKAISAARINFLNVIRRYTLSEIMSTEDVYANIHEELKPLIKKQLKGAGFDLISIRVANIKPKNEAVYEQYARLWRAKLEVALESQEATDRALHDLEMQTGKSEAELSMIKAIIGGVDKARQDGAVIDIKTAVSLRLIQAMEGLVTHAEENESEPASPELTTSQSTLALLQSQLYEQHQGGDD